MGQCSLTTWPYTSGPGLILGLKLEATAQPAGGTTGPATESWPVSRVRQFDDAAAQGNPRPVTSGRRH